MSVPRIRVAVLAGCIAVSSLAVAGCGGGSSSSTAGASGASGASGTAQVSAADFMASVCPAFVGLQSTVAKQEAAFQQAISGSKDPVAGKRQLESLMSKFASTSQQFATTVEAAGTPDVPNGDQIKSQLDAYLAGNAALFQQAESQAHALPTSSPQALNSAAASLVANLGKKKAELQQPGLTGSSSELKQAAEQTPSCQPLIHGG